MMCAIRPFSLLLAAVAALLAAGCAATPAVPATTAPAPTASQVTAALGRWDQLVGRRNFFTTIHALGRRTTAAGVLDYRSPTDFRITAVTELGIVLFDARYGPSGPVVVRTMPGLSETIVATLCQDISLAFRPPPDVSRLHAEDHATEVETESPEGHKYTYTFTNPGARLGAIDIKLGVFDTLHVLIPRYDSAGLPQEYILRRPLRSYEITMTFTDE